MKLSFFEYVMCQLFGPPARRKNGQSFWPCPQCRSGSFHSRPSKPGEKERVNCFRCDFWGDEHDMMAWCKVGSTYREREYVLGEWRREYKAEYEPDDEVDSGDDGSPFPPGTGTLKLHDVEIAYRAMTFEERATLHEAWLIANHRGVWIGRLAPFCYFSLQDQYDHFAHAYRKRSNTDRGGYCRKKRPT